MPSSVLTLVLSQFDKAVFLRFFDLRLLGIYGVASNIAGQVESLISRTSEMVVYPRSAHNFRTDPSTFAEKYYTDNIRVFAVTGAMAAAVGGAGGWFEPGRVSVWLGVYARVDASCSAATAE